MKIKLPKCKIRLFVFFLYNLFYVLYMVFNVSKIYYFFFLALFILINFFLLINQKNKKLYCKKDFKLGTISVVALLLISLFIQLYHLDFKISYLLNNILRLFLPILNAFLFVNTTDEKDQKYFLNILLFRFVLTFTLENYTYFNINALKSISWINSNSLMESSIAHDFIIMEMYYLYKSDRKKALLCMILCMLSMKRLSFILAPVLYVLNRFVPKNIEVKKKYLNLLKIFTIVSPFIILFLYSDQFMNFLSGHGINLNSIMTGRPYIYQLVKDYMPYYNGLGSINNFLETFTKTTFGTTWNSVLHNDFLRLYLETTIIGVIFFANNIIEISKKEYWHFIMICYLIFILITSHLLGYFSVWITFYIVVFSNNASHERGEKVI